MARTPGPPNGLAEVHASLSVIPPIERLLIELLAEIFMLCISHNDYPPLINKSAGPPMSLCCVCKRSLAAYPCCGPQLPSTQTVSIENDGKICPSFWTGGSPARTSFRWLSNSLLEMSVMIR